MLGAILGDIIGSRHEFNPIKEIVFELFTPDCRCTDDTVLTMAVADALLTKRPFVASMVRWANAYPHAGYGQHFMMWALAGGGEPYGSWGNGSAMRVSPVSWLSSSLKQAAEIASASAEVTHNDPHGLRGAKATAVAGRMALEGWTAEEIRNVIQDRFGYNLSRTLDDIRPGYGFRVSCQKSVPEALLCFLSAGSFEETVRLAVSLGGDADTQAAIAGGVAEAAWGVPDAFKAEAYTRCDGHMRLVMDTFYARIAGSTYPKTDPSEIPRDHNVPKAQQSEAQKADAAAVASAAEVESVFVRHPRVKKA